MEEVLFFSFTGGGLTNFQKEKEDNIKKKLTIMAVVAMVAALISLGGGVAIADTDGFLVHCVPDMTVDAS